MNKITSAQIYCALEDLVKALDDTHWSSWQTTAKFDQPLERAKALLTLYDDPSISRIVQTD